jgi:hypothetical protein
MSSDACRELSLIAIANLAMNSSVRVQGVVRDLAQKCGCHALTLMLAASAVKQDTVSRRLDKPGITEWNAVLEDLTRKIGRMHPGSYGAPMQAYSVSLERQSKLGKSILSTLCLFPAVRKAPMEMVREIWRAASEGKRKERAAMPAKHTCHGEPRNHDHHDDDATFKVGLDSLAMANIIDVQKTASGAEGVLG